MDPNSAHPDGPSSADLIGPGPADLIERIENARFDTTRRRGYDEEEVDTFLDKLVAALSGGAQMRRSELRDVRFTTTVLRPGYAMPEVDTFLEEVDADLGGFTG